MLSPSRTLIAGCVVALVAAATPGVAHGQEDSGLKVDYVADGALTVGFGLVAYLLERQPVKTNDRWNRELFGSLDRRVRSNFSKTASRISDATLTLSIVSPVILTFSDGFDEAAGERALIYSETLALTAFPAAAIKFLVSRPRPYTYSNHPSVGEYTQREGPDSHKSFYSGHSSMSFAAAVSSSMLFATQSDNKEARMAAWGLQLALATTTANLRIRAGKHFYSDVVIGALLGSTVAYGVVALHTDDDELYKPSGGELAAMGIGVAAGALFSQLIPLSRLPDTDAETRRPMAVVPMAIDGGAGLSLLGLL